MGERLKNRFFLAFGRIYKWSNLNWPNPEQVDLNPRAFVSMHLLWIWPISLFSSRVRKELQGSGKIFHFFQEKSRVFFMNSNSFGIFRFFSEFVVFGHLVIEPFFRHFFFRHLNFGL
jgi:hypothetical protein